MALLVGSSNWVHKTWIHSIQRWRHFGAKTSWSTWTAPPLFILDPVFLIRIDHHSVIYICQLDEIHYLETRSCRVNTSFIVKKKKNKLILTFETRKWTSWNPSAARTRNTSKTCGSWTPNSWCQRLKRFPLSFAPTRWLGGLGKHFQPSLIFANMAGAPAFLQGRLCCKCLLGRTL